MPTPRGAAQPRLPRASGSCTAGQRFDPLHSGEGMQGDKNETDRTSPNSHAAACEHARAAPWTECAELYILVHAPPHALCATLCRSVGLSPATPGDCVAPEWMLVPCQDAGGGLTDLSAGHRPLRGPQRRGLDAGRGVRLRPPNLLAVCCTHLQRQASPGWPARPGPK